MELFAKRVANLFCVKSIITIVLTGVFAYMTVTGHVSSDQFLTVFTVVIAFYFGVQAEKKASQLVDPVSQGEQKAQETNG